MGRAILLAAMIGAFGAIPVAAQAQPAGPNVIVFLVDDMGYTDSATYGSGYYETPNMDRLAAAGMQFTSAYAPSNVCSSSRASILTGMSPGRLHLSNWISGHGDAGKPLSEPAWTKQLRQDRQTIAEALRAQGYATAHIGKWHLGQAERSEADPTTQGFDVNVGGTDLAQPNAATGDYFADSEGSFGLPGLGRGSSMPGEYLTDRLTRAATDYIGNQAAAAKPFFLYLSHYAVHTPIQAKPGLIAKYQAKPTSGGHTNATYAAMLESMDDSLGAILDKLADPDGSTGTSDAIADETVLFFVSDNGGLGVVTSNAPLRAGKGTYYEGGVRTPMLVSWPGHTAPGSSSDEPVIGYDIYDTILEIAGAPGSTDNRALTDGVGLVDVLEQTGSRGGELYFHFPHYHAQGGRPHSAIRDGDWKLILDYEDGGVELYDLAADIGETSNLATVNAATTAELRDKLERYLIEIDAQLPGGTPVTLPGRNMTAGGVISINIATSAITEMGPQEFAGVVEENHWNNAISTAELAGSGSIEDLLDGNGDPTGASFSFEAGYMGENDNGATADYRMMNAWAGNETSGTGGELSVRDIPEALVAGGYDVYVYFDSDDANAQVSFTIGATTLYGRELPANFDGFFVQAPQNGVTGFEDAGRGNYVLFRDLRLSDFDLIVDASGDSRGPVNGIQIVQVPEPGSASLLCVGFSSLLARRRRKVGAL